MGCAASTQEDNVATTHSHRGGLRGERRHASTLPDFRTVPRISHLTAGTAGNGVQNQRSPLLSVRDGSEEFGGQGGQQQSDDTPRGRESGGGQADDEPQMSSPTQIRLLAKKQVSPLNGRTVCSLALVDALPRFVAPVVTPGALKVLSIEKKPEIVAADHGSGDAVLLSVSPPCSPDAQPSSKHPRQHLGQLDPATHLQPLEGAAMGQQGGSSPLSVRSHGVRDCSICLTELAGCSVVVMACLHTFHYECAKEWLSQHDGSCPDCRTKVCVENFTFPQEIDGDAEYARQEQADEDRQQNAAAALDVVPAALRDAPNSGSREASYEVGNIADLLPQGVELTQDFADAAAGFDVHVDIHGSRGHATVSLVMA